MQICHRDITITDTLATANTFTLDYMYSVQQVRVQLPTSADNMALPAFAAVCFAAVLLLLSAGQQSVDTSCSLGPQQQTCSSRVQQVNGTDRWTYTVLLHRPCSAYCRLCRI